MEKDNLKKDKELFETKLNENEALARHKYKTAVKAALLKNKEDLMDHVEMIISDPIGEVDLGRWEFQII